MKLRETGDQISATKTTPSASAWTFVLVVFVLSRVLFLGVGAVAAYVLPSGEAGQQPWDPSGLLSYWAHFDGSLYVEIATEGYDGPRTPLTTVFFPLFPMLVRAGTALGGGPVLWGVLVSLAATFFALYFMYRIAEEIFDIRVARATTLALAFFPTAFFLNAVYTEALFLAFAAGSFWAARVRRDLLLAGVLGALAAATRQIGVLLLIPLAYEWLRNRQEFGWWGLWRVGLVPTGFLGYTVFLWIRFGDPLVFTYYQRTHWHHELANPVTTLGRAWVEAGLGLRYIPDLASIFLGRVPAQAIEISNTVNFASLALFIVLAVLGFFVLPAGLSTYAFVVTLVPILTPTIWQALASLDRYLLSAFPLFFALGYLLSRSRPALVLWLIASSGLGMALTAVFVSGRWVA